MGTETLPTRIGIQNARHEALHQAIQEGITNNYLLTKISEKAEYEFTNMVGQESERNFDEYIEKINFVESTRNASKIENLLLEIDRWIILDKIFKLSELPVQIKSSLNGVNYFKYGDSQKNIEPHWTYVRLAGLMIVINARQPFKSFRLDLYNEVLRVESLIDSNHIHPDVFLKR